MGYSCNVITCFSLLIVKFFHVPTQLRGYDVPNVYTYNNIASYCRELFLPINGFVDFINDSLNNQHLEHFQIFRSRVEMYQSIYYIARDANESN